MARTSDIRADASYLEEVAAQMSNMAVRALFANGAFAPPDWERIVNERVAEGVKGGLKLSGPASEAVDYMTQFNVSTPDRYEAFMLATASQIALDMFPDHWRARLSSLPAATVWNYTIEASCVKLPSGSIGILVDSGLRWWTLAVARSTMIVMGDGDEQLIERGWGLYYNCIGSVVENETENLFRGMLAGYKELGRGIDMTIRTLEHYLAIGMMSFVLLHEFAHVMLDHAQAQEDTSEKERERHADTLAYVLLSESGKQDAPLPTSSTMLLMLSLAYAEQIASRPAGRHPRWLERWNGLRRQSDGMYDLSKEFFERFQDRLSG